MAGDENILGSGESMKNLAAYRAELEKINKILENIKQGSEEDINLWAKKLKIIEKINQIESKAERAAHKLLTTLRTRSKIEEDINKDAKSLVGYVKQVKSLNKEISGIKSIILGLEKEDAKANEFKINILKRETKELEAQRDSIVDAVKNTNKWGSGLQLAAKAITSIADGIKSGYGTIKGSGLFEMDKAIKNAALSMGILSKQSDEFRGQIKDAASETVEFGMGIDEISKIQASYSDSMGTTVMLGKEAEKSLAAVAVTTGLGAEEMGKFAGSMGDVGISAERTGDYIQQTMMDAHSMGLNSSKVIKAIASNIKLLNKYNFKGGANGLAKMVEETQRMGVNIDMVAPMAEKLFNIEGAVEMSAQLQVLGGEWAKLADPFKLMYMARNDMDGLTKEVIKATTATAYFNKESGHFEISSLEMQRLRSVAEATGLDFTELAAAAKKAAQYAGIKKQISYGFDEQTEKFIESTSTLDKNGRAEIVVNGSPKFVSDLTASDKNLLVQRASEKNTMLEMAKNNMTFDDALNNTITLFKQSMLPLVETMNTELLPKVTAFIKRFNEEHWGARIGEFAKTVGSLISVIGGWIIDNPIKSAFIYGAAKFTGFLFETAEWFKNGIALSEGFLLGTGGEGGGMTGNIFKTIKNLLGGKGGGGGIGAEIKTSGAVMEGMAGKTEAEVFGKTMGSGFDAAAVGETMGTEFSQAASSPIARLGGIATGLITAVSSFISNKEKGMGTGEAAGRGLLSGGGAGLGAWGGAASGAALGSLVGPIGTVIGGLIGAAVGAWGGGKLGDAAGNGFFGSSDENAQRVDDGVIQFNPRDKFMKVNDATMIAGTNENGNRDLAAQLATPNRSMTQSSMSNNLNVNFNQLTLGGTIELKLDNNYSRELGTQLIHNPEFIRSLTRMINMEVEKNLNGGKSKG